MIAYTTQHRHRRVVAAGALLVLGGEEPHRRVIVKAAWEEPTATTAASFDEIGTRDGLIPLGRSHAVVFGPGVTVGDHPTGVIVAVAGHGTTIVPGVSLDAVLEAFAARPAPDPGPEPSLSARGLRGTPEELAAVVADRDAMFERLVAAETELKALREANATRVGVVRC